MYAKKFVGVRLDTEDFNKLARFADEHRLSLGRACVLAIAYGLDTLLAQTEDAKIPLSILARNSKREVDHAEQTTK